MRQWFINLPLRRKVLLFVSISLVFMMLTNTLSVYMFFRINDTTQLVTKNWLPSVQNIGNMLVQLNYYRAQEFRHILQTAAVDMDTTESNMRRALSLYRASAKQYELLILSPEEDALYKKSNAAFDEYYAISQTVLRYSRQNSNDSARNVMLGASFKNYILLRQVLMELNEYNARGTQSASDQIDITISQVRWIIVGSVFIVVILLLIAGTGFSQYLVATVNSIGSIAKAVAEGDTSQKITQAEVVEGSDELSSLAKAMNEMITSIELNNREKYYQQWVTEGQYGLGQIMNGEKELETLCTDIITYLCTYIKAEMGVLYIANEDKTRVIVAGTYCCPRREDMRTEFGLNEGIAGQVCYERKMLRLDNIPAGYGLLYSAVGTTYPNNVIALPCMFRDTLYGVVEVISFTSMDDEKTKFLHDVTESIAIAINSGITRANIARLLDETNQRAAELSVSYEEITRQQEVLTQQTRDIELANTELLERNSLIERQQAEMKYAVQQAELYMRTVYDNPQLIALADYKTLQFKFMNEAGRQYLDIPTNVTIQGLDKTIFWDIDDEAEKQQLRVTIQRELAENGKFSVQTHRRVWGGKMLKPTHISLYVVEYDSEGLPAVFAEVMQAL